MITHNWIAKGRVQGVGFRYFTYTLAKKYGLRGWVKNLTDGNVEIMVQGEDAAVKNLKKYLMRGNMFIKVRELQERIIEGEDFLDFEIKY